MKRHLHLVICIVILLITGCAESIGSVPVTDEQTIGSSTSLPTDTYPPSQPSETPTMPSSVSGVEITDIPPKTPLISYVLYGGDGEASSEWNTCQNWLGPHERFLLYDDGQLILYKSGSVVEARLTQFEIQDLLSDLESTGFHEIQESIEAPDGYDIYELPDDYQYGDGGWGRSIAIEGRSIHIRDELLDFIIPTIDDTITIIEGYEPAKGAVPYIPSNLEMFALSRDSGYLSEWSFPLAQEWPPEFPPIDHVFLFLDENETTLVLDTDLYSSFPDVRTFIYDGTEFIVFACPSRLKP
jgi:hypothetical protein